MRSKKHLRSIIISAATMCFITSNIWGETWSDFSKTGASLTELKGIEGSNYVGYYFSGGSVGFLYNSQTDKLTTLRSPWCGLHGGTYTQSINGDNIVGYYNTGINNPGHGFLYNNTTKNWTNLDYPGAAKTIANGIYGSLVVGNYTNNVGLADYDSHGFIYNTTNNTWTTFEAPDLVVTAGGGTYTYATDIEGNIIVGNRITRYGMEGYIYNITGNTFTNLDSPGSSQTYLKGINGNNIVGYYDDNSGREHGFLYNGKNWSTLDYPGALNTYMNDISGNTIVGESYQPNSLFGDYPFIYTIPEPATILLLGLGAAMINKKAKIKK